MEGGRSLTRVQFEEVLRRATELAMSEPEGRSESEGPDGEPRIPESEVIRIAGEVGIPESHVRQALAELGRTPQPAAGWVDRWFGPRVVAVHRVVPGSPAALMHTLDEFLVGGQLLQPVRRGRDFATYRPAVDWLSRFAQAAASTSRRYYWASAREVEIHVHSAGSGRSRVEIRVDPGARNDAVGGAVGGAAFGGAGMVGVGIALAAGAGFPVLAAGAIALAGAGGIGALSMGWGRSHLRNRNREVREELEGVLDRLEMGEGLEPPPASWRRWVQRQARMLRVDLLGEGQGERGAGRSD